MMSGCFGIVGCGYVGSAVASYFRSKGFEVTGTTRNPSRLTYICDFVDHPRIYRAEDSEADVSFLDGLDGLLIAVAPTLTDSQEDTYQMVYGKGVPALINSLNQRSTDRPLHVIYLSSAGVYGNQGGAMCDEITPPDRSHSNNAILAGAEDAVLSLNSSSINSCILRLGGIYGPNKDIASFICSASGQIIPKNGDHIKAWIHLNDIIYGVYFAFQNRLEGIYNLVDDLQLSRRDLSNMLCARMGIAPVIWDNYDQPDSHIFHARVSNSKLRALGFQPSVRSMFDFLVAA
ncbi:NAD-dependent epimerase/dehydratase family protein [Synechococcus sp. M16CYN]|uniref:NAD-dependent epimerase/dehydratase family protein n=1 Tax=Synechococcus sp. M16CYN TaxID=3103139 RepID=UPI003254ACEA